ncbi:hypothetical protein FRC04_003100 [Tulasnella sp. 424]|nr:hypothetical protein FRC04_003100 [Tulasnella sp. 424]
MIISLTLGSNRPEWMKDKKAVDAKKAEIKQQLARQGMIRGQAKTPATVHHHHHQRNPSSSSQRSTYLNIPGLQRSTDASAAPRRTSTSPSPSSNAGPVPIRTRPERAAKTQARAALRISPDGTEASGNSDEDEELGSASDDGGDEHHGRNRSAIDVDHPMSMKDSSGRNGGAFSEVHKLFESSSARGAASSTATPSFPNSPLHGAGGLGELDGGFSGLLESRSSSSLVETTQLTYLSSRLAHSFWDASFPPPTLPPSTTTITSPSAEFTINGLGGGDSSMDHLMNDNPFSHFGSGGLHDLSSGAEDPYANLNIAMDNSMGVGVGFDFFAATMAASAIQAHAHQKEHNSMSISIPPKATLDVLATAVQPDSISPPILTSTTGTTPGGGSASNSPLIGTTAGTAPNNNGARRPSIPAIGMTVTSPTGITLPAAFSNPAAFTGGMLGASSVDTSYFPSQSVRTSPPPVPTVQTTPPPPSTSSILSNSRARSKTATSGLSAASSTASANVTRGYFPQPAQPFPPFVPNAAQQTPAFGTLTISYKPQIRTPLADPNRSLSSFQETLVFYYFNRGVRRMQYLLADDSTTGVTDVMYDLVIRDPLGPVTNAICSLSSLHDTRLRIAHGQLHPEDPHAHDIAQKLYHDTVIQLSKKAGKFTAVEAIASLHLLSFWLFCGGGGDWASALGMAGDWLMGTELVKDGVDPIEVLEKWPPVQRFAAQAILWFDILGSCSLQQAPRFIKLYTRMSDRNQRLAMASSVGQPSILFGQRKLAGQPSELMNQVMGCDDDIMFALAKIADLAAWKEQQEAALTLSIPELVERGRVIEQELKATKIVVSPLSTSGPARPSAASIPTPAQPAQPGAAGFAKTAPPVWDPYNVGSVIPQPSEEQGLSAGWNVDPSRTRSTSMNSPSPPIGPTGRAASASSSSVTGAPGPLSIITTAEPITLRQLSSNVFREAAFLFLHSVVSGPEPNVKEIKESVDDLIQSILAIPSTDLDRSLAFPITIGGCLAATAEQRSFFADRLAAQGSAVGNGSQAKLLMETVWKRRDSGEKKVCWRDTMKTLQFDLLLV